MELSFDQDYSKAYSGIDFNSEASRTPFQSQNIALNDALKRYDISAERSRVLIDEMTRLSTYRYMNMRYLAAAVYIMERFSDFEGSTSDLETSFFEFIRLQFDVQKNLDRFYYNIVDEKRLNEIPNYLTNLKRDILSYCYKIYRTRQA